MTDKDPDQWIMGSKPEMLYYYFLMRPKARVADAPPGQRVEVDVIERNLIGALDVEGLYKTWPGPTPPPPWLDNVIDFLGATRHQVPPVRHPDQHKGPFHMQSDHNNLGKHSSVVFKQVAALFELIKKKARDNARDDEVAHLDMCVFFTPKKSADPSVMKLRVIMDCRNINDHFQPPPCFNMFRLEEFLEALMEAGEKTWVTLFDLRHWYWQIPLPERLRRFFRWCYRAELRIAKALAMGFTWSPIWGQSITWGIVGAAVLRTARDLNETTPDLGMELPGHLRWTLRNGTTVRIFIVLDGGIVLGPKDVAEKIRKELDKVSKAKNGPVFKDLSARALTDYTPDSPGTFTGIAFCRKDNTTQWRVANPPEAYERCRGGETPTKLREVSQVIGGQNWIMRSRGEKVWECDEFADVVHHTGTLGASSDWQAPAGELGPRIRDIVRGRPDPRAWIQRLGPFWEKRPEGLKIRYFAVDGLRDSAKYGPATSAYVELVRDGAGSACIANAQAWHPQVGESQLRAEIEALVTLVETEGTPDTYMVIAEDNETVRMCVETGVASSAVTRDLVQRIHRSPRRAWLKMVRVPGDTIAADYLTRGEEPDRDKVEKTLRVLESAERTE